MNDYTAAQIQALFGNAPAQGGDITTADLEHAAVADTIVKVAALMGEDVSDTDFSGYSIDDLHTVLDALSEGEGQEKVAGLGISEEQFNEAAVMGQILANSAIAEWREQGVFGVEKTAGPKLDAMIGAVKRFGRSVGGRESAEDTLHAYKKMHERLGGPKSVSILPEGFKREVLKTRLKNRAAAGGGVAALGGAGYAGYRHHQNAKRASLDFDGLNPNSVFDQRAAALADALVNGEAELEKTAGLDAYIQEAALEVLRANGYDV